MKKKLSSLIVVMLLVCFQINAQKTSLSDKKNPKETNKPKNYNDIITKDAITDKGLFDVHKVKDKYYYEISDSLFGREMLMVTRISKTASGIGFGGGKQNTQVLRWQKKK